jgi:hypothetical protein
MKATVLKLIVKRLAVGIASRIWSGWLSVIVFGLLLGLIMYLLVSYECPVRRALGYPLSRSKNVATAFYAHPWEQNCEADSVRP